MNDDALLAVLHDAATAVHAALGELRGWGLAGTRDGQYHSDLAADAAALQVLHAADLGVMSEESGMTHGDRDIIVVLDPVDGSTNASLGIPWFATSLCAVDGDGLRAALVLNQASGERFDAVRGGGARRDGESIQPSACQRLDEAVIGLSGYPPQHLGWMQYRALGASSLDLCAVACGRLDGFMDCGPGAHGPWDYLGGMLICQESGAVVADGSGREMVTLEHAARRAPVAAATPELLSVMVRAHQSARGG